MKKIKFLLILIVFTIILTGCGKNSSESNSWLVDSVAPTSSTKGKNGDMYLDNSTYNLYQMVDSEWIKIGNIAGKDGKDGKNGVDGKDGINGISGSTPTISISKDGYWIINGNKTNIKAEGFNGKDGIDGKNGTDGKDGADGKNGTDGKDGADGKNGTDGKDGITPTIKFSEDGYWIINGEKTLLTISEDGYWIINGEKTNTKAFEKTLATICKYQNNGVPEKTAGAKYSCEVKPGTSYNFYVLKTPIEGDTTINLIMDQNINSDGTPAGMTGTIKSGENVYNLVAWNNQSGQTTTAYGPVTAMTYLYNATKDWTNIDSVNYTYNDKIMQGTTAENTSYTSFISTNGVATITTLSGDEVTIGTSDKPLRARIPIYSSDTTITEVTSKTNSSYLYDNINSNGVVPHGYWALSSQKTGSNRAWFVYYGGFVGDSNMDNSGSIGVRPVITLKI